MTFCANFLRLSKFVASVNTQFFKHLEGHRRDRRLHFHPFRPKPIRRRRCPLQRNFSKQHDDRRRSRSTKLLKSMVCSGLGLGGGLWPFLPLSNAWTALRLAVCPKRTQARSSYLLDYPGSFPDANPCRHHLLACCSLPTTRLTLASQSGTRKPDPVGTVDRVRKKARLLPGTAALAR